MLFGENLRKIIVGTAALLAIVLFGSYFINGLRPVASPKAPGEKIFEVKAGEGFFGIVKRLGEERLIRRPIVFKAVSLITGAASHLKPGIYKLSPTMNSLEILGLLLRGPQREVAVLIPEGSSLYEVDAILATQGVFPKKSLIRFSASSSQSIEGRLFPDTYRFFVGTSPESVSEKFLDNFETKAAPFLNQDKKHFDSNLILASLLQKEVPEPEDQRIIAGILKKRLEAGMPLQIDATICYIKEREREDGSGSCYPLAPLDFKINSPYNTYLYKGLPPGPIGNPGTSSIIAALNPKSSPFWFYLSDPATKKTIFAETLDEHEENRVKYLRR